MYVIIAKFDCRCHEGLPQAKKRKVVFGIVQSLRKQLGCSVEQVDGDMESSVEGLFSIGLSFVLERAGDDVESRLSNQVGDLIERKGEVEVSDYLCTVVNFSDLVGQEELVTVH